TITVLVVQNGQGIAVLRAAGHQPPITAITIACGLGSMITAFAGAVPTTLTGPVNAIISGSGERHRQYTAGILVGLLGVAFGLLSPFVTRLTLAMPGAFIAAIAGLAMLGALVTFLVTAADVPILGVGAPFWGLVLGFATSLLLEREDLKPLEAR